MTRTSFRNKQISSACFPHATLLYMFDKVQSHAGEKGLFDMKPALMSFVPLSAISLDAQVLQEKYLVSIQARIDAEDCPRGLQKQYKLQLEHIKAQAPSHEILLLQSIGFSLGKGDSLGRSFGSLNPHQKPPTRRGSTRPSC